MTPVYVGRMNERNKQEVKLETDDSLNTEDVKVSGRLSVIQILMS